jgi:hypothetical protein
MIEHGYVETSAGRVHKAAELVRESARDSSGATAHGSSPTSPTAAQISSPSRSSIHGRPRTSKRLATRPGRSRSAGRQRSSTPQRGTDIRIRTCMRPCRAGRRPRARAERPDRMGTGRSPSRWQRGGGAGGGSVGGRRGDAEVVFSSMLTP